MLLVAGKLRVALATTHLPLRAVADAITERDLLETLRVLAAGLRDRFGLVRPRILVLGLNPHAGESGHLGREEIDVIAPAIARAVAEGIAARGPLPADTAFTPRQLTDADAVLAMYHDQGLPVLKYAGFGHAVNVTLGLPIVRTSVDHGTALDLAGTGRADAGSLSRRSSSPSPACAREPAAGRPAGATPGPQALRPALPARSGRHRAHRRGDRPAARRPPRRDRPGPRRTDAAAARARRPARGGRDRPRRDPAAARSAPVATASSSSTRPTRSASTSARCAARGPSCGCAATCPTTSRRRCCSTCSSTHASIADMHFMLQKEVVDAHGGGARRAASTAA